MEPDQSSRTAEYMAFFRACETVRPETKRLFTDPFAKCFIRPELLRAVRLSKVPILGGLVHWYADRRLPGARTSAIARTRLIDDDINVAIQDGARQLVIVGTGYDCRAYRLPIIKGVAIFEVDYPSTLAGKRFRLETRLQGIPQNVRFVRIDFNRDRLSERLCEAGFDRSLSSVFVWEGVTNYLTSEALRFISSCAAGTRIIFSYVHSGALDGSVYFDGAADIIRDVAQLGEPWTFGLDPAKVPEFLDRFGLRLDRDLSARDYRIWYYGLKGERMRGYDFYHVVSAHLPSNIN
jgi:methyltransferase (TIGR00027 family)